MENIIKIKNSHNSINNKIKYYMGLKKVIRILWRERGI